MITKTLRILLCAAGFVGLAACEEKSTGEKVEDAVKDGLDVRPAEKLKDTGEDIKDAVK